MVQHDRGIGLLEINSEIDKQPIILAFTSHLTTATNGSVVSAEVIGSILYLMDTYIEFIGLPPSSEDWLDMAIPLCDNPDPLVRCWSLLLIARLKVTSSHAKTVIDLITERLEDIVKDVRGAAIIAAYSVRNLDDSLECLGRSFGHFRNEASHSVRLLHVSWATNIARRYFQNLQVLFHVYASEHRTESDAQHWTHHELLSAIDQWCAEEEGDARREMMQWLRETYLLLLEASIDPDAATQKKATLLIDEITEEALASPLGKLLASIPPEGKGGDRRMFETTLHSLQLCSQSEARKPVDLLSGVDPSQDDVQEIMERWKKGVTKYFAGPRLQVRLLRAV